jgi:hypothetical protein
MAITGKSAWRRNRGNKPNLLPWVATGCRGRQMVRMGSTVRVRQRALQKPALEPPDSNPIGVDCCEYGIDVLGPPGIPS